VFQLQPNGLNQDFTRFTAFFYIAERKPTEIKQTKMANTEVAYPTQYDSINSTRRLTVQEQSHVESVETITAGDLAQCLLDKTDAPLIIDCRSFIAYNAGHVATSINVNCADRLMRKRLMGGKVRLVDLIACPEAKRRLAEGGCTKVVAYDDDTVKVTTSSQSSLLLILGMLVNLGKNVSYLEGAHSS
jgi:hypothetical protein